MKSALLIASLFSLSILLLSTMVLYGTHEHTEFLEKRASLVIRKIGHSLLLQAGDSSSRILPVKRVDGTTFQLEFQSNFSFVPDSLVEIVRANLAENDLPLEYIVNVMECQSHEVVYGFAMGTEHRDIVPCMGRVQPEGCYAIQITFDDIDIADTKSKQHFLFMIALGSLLVFGYVGKLWAKNKWLKLSSENHTFISIGKWTFYQGQGILENADGQIMLSDKETKLLGIFARRQNQLIERDQLLKEVWEDEGVITGRSLDVFISKLRKKLKSDPSTQIVNVHGKGYKLVVNV